MEKFYFNENINILKKFDISISEKHISPSFSLYNIIKHLVYNNDITSSIIYLNESEKLPKILKNEFYNLFFSDFFLSSIILKEKSFKNKLFSMGNSILNNKYSAEEIKKNLTKIDPFLLPIAMNILFQNDNIKIEDNLLQKMSKRTDKNLIFIKYSISSLLILRNEIDRGLKLFFENFSTIEGNLLLLFSYFKTNDIQLIKLMIEEKSNNITLSYEILDIIGKLITTDSTFHIDNKFYSIMKNLPLPLNLNNEIIELLNKNYFETIINKSNIDS